MTRGKDWVGVKLVGDALYNQGKSSCLSQWIRENEERGRRPAAGNSEFTIGDGPLCQRQNTNSQFMPVLYEYSSQLGDM
jgi:hypothetical protein